MCLDRLDPKVKAELGKQRTGYKVFVTDDGGLSATDQGSKDAKPRNEWLDEADYRTVPEKHSFLRKYRFGFHVCLTVEGAKHWARMVRDNGCNCVVTAVKFKYPNAWGYQDGYHMAVARQVMILEDECAYQGRRR